MKVSVTCCTIRHIILIKFNLLLRELKMLNKLYVPICLVFFVILALNSFHISICITSLFVQEYEDGLIHNRRHNVFFFLRIKSNNLWHNFILPSLMANHKNGSFVTLWFLKGETYSILCFLFNYLF
jgi:hypothetical protein